jgi:hypothetical protein
MQFSLCWTGCQGRLSLLSKLTCSRLLLPTDINNIHRLDTHCFQQLCGQNDLQYMLCHCVCRLYSNAAFTVQWEPAFIVECHELPLTACLNRWSMSQSRCYSRYPDKISQDKIYPDLISQYKTPQDIIGESKKRDKIPHNQIKLHSNQWT